MVSARTIRTPDEEGRLAAVSLHTACKNRGVFRAAEVQGLIKNLQPHFAAGFVEDVNQFLVGGEVNGFTHLAHVVGDRESLGDAFDDVCDLFAHVVVDFHRFAAHFKLHDGLGGDHVAAFAGNELTDVDAGHAAAVAGNAQHLNGGVGGSGKRVAAFLGAHARVGGAAVKGDVVLRGAQEPVEVRGEFTRLRKHRNVRGEEVVAVVQNAA